MTTLHKALEDAKRNERHNTIAETRYWLNQYKMIAEQALAAPVQEPVAFNAGVPPLYPEMKDGETISVEYTTPPAAQRQWIGLTPHERMMCRSYDIDTTIDKTEAKLKEKNGLHRQHVIDGSPCWCEPETSYTDPETGASVVVHKEPQ